MQEAQFNACQYGNFNMPRKNIIKGNPFEIAKEYINQNKLSALKALVSSNKSILHQSDADNNTLLHHAILSLGSKSRAILGYLIDSGADVNAVNQNGQTGIHLAAETGLWKGDKVRKSQDLFSFLAKRNANVTLADGMGFTALHHAAGQNNVQAIKQLIELGCFVDHVNQDGVTPLHIAALCNQFDAFKLLIKYKANSKSQAYPSFRAKFNFEDQYTHSLTPLWLAFEMGNQKIVKEIIATCVRAKDFSELKQIRTAGGDTLLHFFSAQGDLKYVKLLLEAGCCPLAQDAEGRSSLHVAVASGNFNVVTMLIKHLVNAKRDLNLESRTFDGKTAWMLAHEYKHEIIANYLRRNGAKRVKLIEPQRPETGAALSFIQRQIQNTSELEGSSIYQSLNAAKMLAHVLMSYSGGPVTMGLQLLQQVALYSTPAFMHKASLMYYKVKPFIHNHTNWLIEDCFDSAATLSSNTVFIGFKGMRLIDYATNPTRCGVGLATSHILANLAGYYTSNKDAQAAMLFMGREIGFTAVDAYQYYGAQQSSVSESLAFETELNQGLTIWGSILGKAQGEAFVYGIHSISQFKNEFYQAIGWAEHTAIEAAADAVRDIRQRLISLESFNALEAALQESTEVLTPLQGYLSTSKTLFLKVQQAQKEVHYWRDRTLQEIEGWIYDNIIPESNYQKYASFYLIQTKLSLLSHKLLESEAEKKYAQTVLDEATNASISTQSAKQSLDKATAKFEEMQQSVAQCREEMQAIWDSTPKAIRSANLEDAHNNELLSRVDLEEATIQRDYVVQHEGSPEIIEEAETAVLQLKEDNFQAAAISTTAEQALREVSTSLEEGYLSERLTHRHHNIEQAAISWRTHQTTLLNAYDDFIQSEISLEKSRAVMEEHSHAFKIAQQAYDENEQKLYDVEHPGPIDIYKTVDNAVRDNQGDDYKKKVIKIVIDDIAATGVVSVADAYHRMEPTFITAQDSKQWDLRRDHLVKRATEQFNQVLSDYKENYLNARVTLTGALNAAHEKYISSSNDYDIIKQDADTARLKYVALLPLNEQQEFESIYQSAKIFSDDSHWKSTHNPEHINQVISVLGQPEIAMGAFLEENRLTLNVHLNRNLFQSMAIWLIEYKYLFVHGNVETMLGEQSALFKDIQGGILTPDIISEQKNKIDTAISENILINAENITKSNISHDDSGYAEAVAKNVIIILHRGLGNYNVDESSALMVGSEPLIEKLTAMISENDEAGAITAIFQSLQENTSSISINRFGKYQPPQPAPEVAAPAKKKKGFLQSVWDGVRNAAETVVTEVLKNGVGGRADGNGAYVGLRGYEHFEVYRFNNQAKNILNLNQVSSNNNPNLKVNNNYRATFVTGQIDATAAQNLGHDANFHSSNAMMPYPHLHELLENAGIAFPTHLPNQSGSELHHQVDPLNDIANLAGNPSPSHSLSLASPVEQMVRQAMHQANQGPMPPPCTTSTAWSVQNPYLQAPLNSQWERLFGEAIRPSDPAPSKLSETNAAFLTQVSYGVRYLKGDRSSEILDWQRGNRESSPKLAAIHAGVKDGNKLAVNHTVSFASRVEAGAVSASHVILGMWDASVGFAELMRDILSPDNFSQAYDLGFTNPVLFTANTKLQMGAAKVIKVLSIFVGEEAARVIADEKLESTKFIRDSVNSYIHNFKEMDENQRTREVSKIVFSFVIPEKAAKGVASVAKIGGSLAQGAKGLKPPVIGQTAGLHQEVAAPLIEQYIALMSKTAEARLEGVLSSQRRFTPQKNTPPLLFQGIRKLGTKSAADTFTHSAFQISPSELIPTHEICYGKNKMKKFVEKIKREGIVESIKYIEHDGKKYVVDGHHKLYAARKLGLEHINVEKVDLPYNGYRTTNDLTY
jgi:ankyrin repeat protein